MGLFPRKKKPPVSGSILQSAARAESQYALPETQDPCEPALYAGLRRAVPVIDAAIGKIVRLTGSFQLVAGDSRMQEQLDEFARSVPVGLTGQSLQTFADAYLDSLLTYGNALGEMLIDNRTGYLGGLQTVPAELVQIRPGSHPLERQYWLRGEQESDSIRIARPERILFTALNPPPGGVYGVSVLRGLPALSHILLRNILSSTDENGIVTNNSYGCVPGQPERSGTLSAPEMWTSGSSALTMPCWTRKCRCASCWNS